MRLLRDFYDRPTLEVARDLLGRVRGLDAIRANRPRRPPRELTSGPARLTRALAIDGALNQVDLVGSGALFLSPGEPVPDTAVAASARVGIDYAEPADRDAPPRFFVAGNRNVSKAR